jgi:predicted dehydrogenase
MVQITIGLIGTGFMGKCHAMAFRAVPAVFPDAPRPVLELLADLRPEPARAAAEAFGFARWTADWRALVEDPAVDMVAITTPNFLHEEMALAAIRAGKHVYCEKPLAGDAARALAMTEAAEAAGVRTLVGYNYVHNPAAAVAREIVAGGEIGEVVHVRGAHNEDFLADPDVPMSWRCRRAEAGAGAMADLGSHIISLARYLVGDIVEVCGSVQTVVRRRPLPDRPGAFAEVDNDDQGQFLARFASGATGAFEASRVARGRKMFLAYEITGTKGSLHFDQERMNELHLFTADGPRGRQGFRTLLMGPEHGVYGAFCPAPGHQLGFNEQKVIEAYRLLRGIATGGPLDPDFRGAYEIARVVDAVLLSSERGRWVKVAEVGAPAA